MDSIPRNRATVTWNTSAEPLLVTDEVITPAIIICPTTAVNCLTFLGGEHLI